MAMVIAHKVYELVVTATLLVLLVAILRHRESRLPRLMIVGVFIACGARIFPLAEAFFGSETLDQMLTGGVPEEGSTPAIFIGNVQLSASFVMLSRIFTFLCNIGVLLIALGFLRHVRDLIREHRFSLTP